MDKKLSPLDWLMPRYYMPLIYCFPSHNTGLRQRLYDGLFHLVGDVPVLLSDVVSREQPVGSVALSGPYRDVEDCFTWQDLTSELDYEAIRKDHFPLAVFNQYEMVPANTLKRPLPVPASVFLARLTLARGGAFLYVGLHHSVTDMVGLGTITKLWAAHCYAQSSSDVSFDPGWLDRSVLCPPFSHMPLEKIRENIPRGLCYGDDTISATRAAAPRSLPQTVAVDGFTAAVFYFSPESLRQMKEAAMYGITLLPAVEEPWVSTNDVLTALLWSAVVWAEDDDNFTSNTDDVSQMKFPVNIRSRWSPRLPDEYLGVAVIQAPVTSPREDLLSLSSGPLITHDTETRNGHILDLEKEKLLAKVSSSIRRALNDIDVKDIRHAIAFTAAVPDVSKISERPRNAVKITSWADQGACEAEWGDVIGRAEAVRFATFSTRVRPIVLPKINSIEGGGLEVFLSLRTKEMARFGASALVERFGCLRTSQRCQQSTQSTLELVIELIAAFLES